MEDNMKEVRFDQWCHKCVHKDTAEKDEPCFECLSEPANVDSHKPVKYVKSPGKKNGEK